MLVDYPFLLRSLTKYRYTCGARGLQDPFFPPFLLSFSCLLCSSLPCFTSLYFTLSLSSPSLLFSGSHSSLAWPVLPCPAMPYPTTRLIAVRGNRFLPGTTKFRIIERYVNTHTHTYTYMRLIHRWHIGVILTMSCWLFFQNTLNKSSLDVIGNEKKKKKKEIEEKGVGNRKV